MSAYAERARTWLAFEGHDLCEMVEPTDVGSLAALLAEVAAEARREALSAASLVDARMLAEARAEGRRQGLEYAAQYFESLAPWVDVPDFALRRVRELAEDKP